MMRHGIAASKHFSILVTIVVMTIGMTGFELVKHYIAPNLTIWQSHIVTIIFGTVVGAVAVYITISKIQFLYHMALTEIDRRKHFQTEIAKISEREKRLLGESLHDGLGQQLTGISYMLQSLGQNCVEKNMAVAEKIFKISDLISNSTNLTRTIARDIYPIELRENGLLVGLEELASNTQNIFNINCEVKYDEKDMNRIVDVDRARQFYLVAQESINNAIKHGKSDHIIIEFYYELNEVFLNIIDNGQGFEKESVGKGGIGFAIMEHRAELVGGVLSIQQSQGGGVIVSLKANALA